jgi:branched-chain amino acid transport system ATP-binding protein
MSGGEQQMLTIARTLMGNPSLVLLDEPSEGLAPVIVEQMAKPWALKARGRVGAAVRAEPAFRAGVADRAYIIEKGQIRFGGTMAELWLDGVSFGLNPCRPRAALPSASMSAAPSPTCWRSIRPPTR